MRVLLALALTLAAQQAPRDTPVSSSRPVLTGTGIIKGRVVAGGTGTPVRRAIVTVAAPGAAFRTIYTDAAGRYEARNLPPGSYSVMVRPNAYQAQFLQWVPPPPLPDGAPRLVPLTDGQTIEWYELTLPRAGAIVGRVVDEHGDPVSGVTVTPQRADDPSKSPGFSAQSSDEFGRYRVYRLEPGDYEIVAKPGSGRADIINGGTSVGFVDTYYPGTLSRLESTRVRVRAGQDTTAADFTLIAARLMRVAGMVVGSRDAGTSGRAMVGLHRDDGGMSTSVDPEGRFTFMPHPPGTYRLTARLVSDNRENTLEYASQSITLTDADITDLVITMKPTVTLAGRVTFDGGTAPTVAPGSLTIRTDTSQRDRQSQLTIAPARVAEDLTFTLSHLAGELLLRPSGGLPGGWSLKAVLLGNEEITDVPRDFRAEDSGRIRIVLTNRWSELSGTVTGDKDERTLSGTVVLFGDDRSTWFAESSRLHAARIAKDGRFVLRGLRAGRYHVVALPPGVRWDFQQIDKAVLEKYAAEATAVTIGEDERRQVDLRLASLPVRER